MGQKSGPVKEPAEQIVKQIRRATRRQFSAEEKIRIADVYSGRGSNILAERQRIKRQTIANRRLQHVCRRPDSTTSMRQSLP